MPCMATTQEQIESIKALCIKIKQIEGVEDCYIDDYGRFGNFQICICKKRRTIIVDGKKRDFRGILSKAKVLTKQVKGAFWRNNELYVVNKNIMLVDIDFQKYNSESNTFEP